MVGGVTPQASANPAVFHHHQFEIEMLFLCLGVSRPRHARMWRAAADAEALQTLEGWHKAGDAVPQKSQGR